MTDIDHLTALFEKWSVPPAEFVGKLPKAGVKLDYVGHAAVTRALLECDPQWSWEPLAYDEAGLPSYDKAGGLWIKLTVRGVTRLGYGDGPDPKQRISDALRNAAMRFGVALSLWSKEEWTEQPEPEVKPKPAARGKAVEREPLAVVETVDAPALNEEPAPDGSRVLVVAATASPQRSLRMRIDALKATGKKELLDTLRALCLSNDWPIVPSAMSDDAARACLDFLNQNAA